MNKLIKILSIFLILSVFNCAEYTEIDSMVKTEFSVNESQDAYFKYKLGEIKGPIGLHFLLANLYTVEVSIYKKQDDEEPFLTYKLAENQFQEIDATDFDDYVYIIIKETYKYFYTDYITVYDSNEVIQLKPSEPLVINNFLSNNKYEMSFTSEKTITLVYNTLITEESKRKITILYENETILNQEEVSIYENEFNPGEINIIVENFVESESDKQIPAQDFSLIVYEKSNSYEFQKVNVNEAIKSKYIYNNNTQNFYYYADISNKVNSNTFNFKLNFKYYLLKNVTFFTKIIYLDNEVTEEDLENNIPTENKLPYSYDEDSDEFLRIYFKDTNSEKQYKYLLVKVQIEENEYYVGSKDIEISLGNEVEIFDLKENDYNDAFTIDKKLIDYIPIYFKLELDPNEKYLLTSQYQDLTSFIKGDLLNENEINNNYLINTNEIIILSGINELTVKVFGSTTNNVIFYIEKIDQKNLMSAEDERNNEIFEIKMNENECNEGIKYILGTYDYETYAYGQNKVNYYWTIDSGDFEVYFKDTINLEKVGSLFPSQQSQIQEKNTEILLDKNIDLFTVKCKKEGTMSIRPVTKEFIETTHKIEQNTINQKTLYDYSEIVQLTTLLGQNMGTVYFSILSLEGDKLTIIPDTPGLFPEQTIENELFFSSADLSKYKMDQLAIRVNSTSLEKNIEILEIIHNKYNTYKKVNKGDNKDITLNNIYIPISEKNKKIKIILENLENKKISYGVINSASNNENYLATADKYPNTTKIELKETKENIDVENIYYNKKDNLKPYMYLLVSVLGEEDSLSYNVKVEIDEEEDSGNNTALIVFILLICAIVLGFIILALFMIVIKKRTSQNDIEMDKTDKLYSQNQNEVDP